MSEKEQEVFFIILKKADGKKLKVLSYEQKLGFRLPTEHTLLGIFPFNAPELQPEGEYFDVALQSEDSIVNPFVFVLPEAS